MRTKQSDRHERQDGRSVGLKKKSFDFAETLRRLEGDEQLFRELAGFFLEDAPILLKQIRNGLQQHDAKTVERGGHSLKGLVANFGAEAGVELAYSVEKLAQQGRLAEVPAALERLDREIAILRQGLKPYVTKG
jgi:two-component system, sensor histidine kinase and response regulator